MYVLQVSGDSMIDALVNNGDYVVMEHTRTAENGDMVAVWLKRKHATTLKRLYRRDGWIVLRPENPTLREKRYRPSDIEIQGKVMCIIRTNSKKGNSLLDRPIQTS
jgi:repressor LexA